MVRITLLLNDIKFSLLHKYFDSIENWNKLNSLYEEVNSTKDSRIKFEIDLLEAEVLFFMAKKNFSEDDKIILRNIRNFYSTNYTRHNGVYVNSSMYNESACLKWMFNDQQRDEIISAREEQIGSINGNIKRYLMGEKLSEEEMNQMFAFLSSDFTGDKYNGIIDSIIAFLHDKNDLTFQEVTFVYYYLNKKESRDYSYEESKVYCDSKCPTVDESGNVEYSDALEGSFSPYAHHHYDGIIVMNSSLLPNKFSSMMLEFMSLAHESRHQKQTSDLTFSKFTAENLAYVEHIMLMESDPRIYRLNYDFDPMELQANYRGSRGAREFLTDCDFSFDNSIYAKRELENRIYNAYRMFTAPDAEEPEPFDNYMARRMEELCVADPALLKRYKLLGLFFNEDGTMFNLNDMLASFGNFKGLDKKIFFPFFKHILDKNEISEDINREELDHVLYCISLSELTDLAFMVDGYDIFKGEVEHHLRVLDRRYAECQDAMIADRKNRVLRYLGLIQNLKYKEEIYEKLNALFPSDSIQKNNFGL